MLQLFSVLILLLPISGQCLETSSLLEGLMNNVLLSRQTNNQSDSLSTCERQLVSLHEARQRHEGWALKAFDASGSGYDDFMLGKSMWLGSRITCRAVNENVLRYFTLKQPELHRSLAPFGFAYHVAYVRANSHWQVRLLAEQPSMLHFGLCVPESCTQVELQQQLQLVLDQQPNLQELQAELVYIKQPQLQGKFFASLPFKLLLGLFSAVLLFTLLATCGWLQGRFMSCFDAAANWQRLWQPNSAQEIAVINGLRVLSALAILILHVSWYTFQSIDQSALMAMRVASIWIYHAYLPATLEVFFTVSGFLTAYNFLSNKQLQSRIAAQTWLGNLRGIGKQLLQRYLRLAPLQLIVVLLVIVCSAYYREASLYHIPEPLDEMCLRGWWQNLLLIQNFYPNTMCANWTWSLASDMQTHMVATLLLYLYVRHPKLVRRLVLGILGANILYSIVLLYVLDLKFKFDTAYKGLTVWFYFDTWVRSLPYIIGSIYGYALAQGKESPLEQLKLNKLTKLAVAVIVFWLFTQLQAEELNNTIIVASGTNVMRSLISVMAAHLIFVSFRIDESSALIRWLVSFLQLKCFQWFGRVTFAFYLLNPLVIYCFNYTFGNVLPADLSILSILSIAYTFVVLVLSILLTLFFELPLHRLSRLLLTSYKTKSKPN